MTARGNEQRAAPLDGPALEALYGRLEKPVFNVVYRWLWSSEESRDVTQEAFLKLWAARARVDAATAEPLVFRAAINLASNRLRARKLWGLFGLGAVEEQPAAGADAQAQLEAAQQRVAVRRAIDGLPEKLKQVVVLCELSGLSYQQIAETLSIPMGTVASRRSAAMASLSKTLGALEDG